MRFVNPLFLIGTLAALLPVIIHLLTRDRIRKVEFSTLRFFAKSSQRVLRRKRYHEVILLAMRMLICSLLAVAFARPFFGRKADEVQTTTVRTARVIVADVSGSMARGQSADKLKAACQKAIGELSDGRDAVALVTFSEVPTVESVLSPKFEDIQSRVGTLVPGQGGTDIPAALQAADDLLKNVRATSKEIVLISDLQRTGWNGGGRAGATGGMREERKLSADVKLIVKSLAPADGILSHTDLVITDHYCPESVVMDQTPQPISVKIANFSAQQINDVPVKLTISGKDVATQKVNLRANAPMLVQFTHVFDTPGDNPIVVQVGPDATHTPEHTVYFNARVMGKIPVVILNGSPSTNRAVDGAFFLSLALSPKGSPPFDVRAINAHLARPEDIAGATVVFVSDVDKLRTGMNKAIYDLLQRGGGVMFLPGENVSANAFNSQFAGTEEFSDLAPCRLKTVLQTQPVPGEVGGISLTKIDFGHPIFKEFAQPHHGDFSGVRFFRWWEVRDYQGAVKAGEKEMAEDQRPRVLARFDDGRPALLDRQIGRGVSMLLASSTDLRWTNFAEKAAVFQPFIHLAAKYLSIRTEQKTAYTVGDLLAIPPGFELKDPQGKAHTDAEMVGQKRGLIAREAGFYQLADKTGKQGFCYAVNVDSAEADIATVTPSEIASAVEQSRDDGTSLIASQQESAREKDGMRIWWYVAAAVAALFAMELFVANRTLRH